MTDSPRLQERIEQLIESEVAHALAPYYALGLPQYVLDEMEMMLRLLLDTHPTAQALLRALAEKDPLVSSS